MTYISVANADAMSRVLATIRTLESGNNYTIRAKGSTASGAYQFLDSTWRYYGARVKGALAYRRAADAPPALQDQVARVMVADILKRYGGQLEAIGPSWYVGRYEPTKLDYVPKPSAGNVLTVRQYQQKWLAAYNRVAGTTITGPTTTGTGQVAYASAMREGARIPLDAYQAGSGKLPYSMLSLIGIGQHRLHYTAAPAFGNLRQAALRAGINLTLTDSYRSYAQQAEGHKRKPGIVAPPGKSMHGYGLAVDLAEGWPPKGLSNTAIAWLKQNARLYGWSNSVPREPWHYVYVGGEDVAYGAPEETLPSMASWYRPPPPPGTEWKAPIGMAEPGSIGTEVEPDNEQPDEQPEERTLIRDMRIEQGWVTDRLSRIRGAVEGTMDGNPLTREAV